jgi:hypothetical protein
MWPFFVSQLKLTANNEKYPHVINVDKGNLEDHQQEGSVEDSLADSYEGNNDRKICHKFACVGFALF